MGRKIACGLIVAALGVPLGCALRSPKTLTADAFMPKPAVNGGEAIQQPRPLASADAAIEDAPIDSPKKASVMPSTMPSFANIGIRSNNRRRFRRPIQVLQSPAPPPNLPGNQLRSCRKVST